MSSELVTWFSYFFRFIYNALYSVNMPGFNIPLLYFFIMFSVLFMLFNIFRRLLFSPHKASRNASVKRSGGESSADT